MAPEVLMMAAGFELEAVAALIFAVFLLGGSLSCSASSCSISVSPKPPSAITPSAKKYEELKGYCTDKNGITAPFELAVSQNADNTVGNNFLIVKSLQLNRCWFDLFV
jgi:hypothetical protein